MDLTPELKAEIDAMDAAELRLQWNVSPLDDPRFRGESGCYWGYRMLAAEKEAAAIAAKAFSCNPLPQGRPTPENAPEAILDALAGPSVSPVAPTAPAADELDVVDELVLVQGMMMRSIKELRSTQDLVQRALDEIHALKAALELRQDDGR